MTLTTRLSLFFMSMLAVVLIGFSTALYLLAEEYLHRQSQERLDAVLSTLGAAVDVGPEGVEWEPDARHLSLETPAYSEQVVWVIGDHQGRLLDRSKSKDTGQFVNEISENVLRSSLDIESQHGPWQVGRRWIRAIDESGTPKRVVEPADEAAKFPKLSITAGVSLEPVRKNMRQLAASLFGLSLAVWVTVLFLGRFICHRALLPVRKMAAAASEMQASDLTGRLPVITSRDELEDLSRAFNSLLDRVQEAYERQRRFTGDASHQFRTPLTAILGQVDVALRKERNSEEYQRVLSTVQQKANHLSRIVESLLFLARADTDAPQPRLEPIDLELWLPAYLETWNGHDRAKDITLDHPGSAKCVIAVEPELFRELLNILLDNACKYSPAGTSIRVKLENDQSEVVVHVVDHGYGIAESDLPNLFVPFLRSDDSRLRRTEGIGLGLSIAKRLTAVFKGELSVTSRQNAETCFTVRLPRTL
jgi:heavy metal sensor kinase